MVEVQATSLTPESGQHAEGSAEQEAPVRVSDQHSLTIRIMVGSCLICSFPLVADFKPEQRAGRTAETAHAIWIGASPRTRGLYAETAQGCCSSVAACDHQSRTRAQHKTTGNRNATLLHVNEAVRWEHVGQICWKPENHLKVRLEICCGFSRHLQTNVSRPSRFSGINPSGNRLRTATDY